jgi:protein-disulfide isomerase
MRSLHVAILTFFVASAAATAAELTRDELRRALAAHPDVVVEAIRSNAKAVFEVLRDAAAAEQARVQKESEEAERRAFEDAFVHPLQPSLDEHTVSRGPANAKYTLVEYSDFECPFCAGASHTVDELRKRYGNELRVVLRHAPLPFHPHAMEAAAWFEAIAEQSPETAWRFHDALFANQEKLGHDFFRTTAASLGLDADAIEKRAASDAVRDRISASSADAARLGFTGTPGFLLNGVPVKGAYPLEHFTAIIERLDAQQKVAAAR